MVTLSTWAVVTAAGGVVNLLLTAVAWRYREEPGGQWFFGMAGLMSGSALLYAAALTVREPFVRHLLEAAFWTAAFQIGVLWAVFALTYTGRGRLVRNRLGWLAAGATVAGSVLILTDPIHGLFFGGFRVIGTEVAAVSFDLTPGLFGLVVALALLLGVAWLLLFDTLADAGPLFRRQTVALVVTPIFPMAATSAFVFDAGPAAGVSLVPLSYAPHAALDLYALYSGDLFEVDPATRRLGRQAALESVEVPIVTVDTTDRVMAANDAATRLFGPAVVGSRLQESLPEPLDPAGDPGRLTLTTDGRTRTFRVRTASFGDGGETLGYTVALQDVTDVLARERRLSVLNRVLRHNLRNDLNVVVGHADLLADAVDESNQRSVRAIQDRGKRLLSVGERARELDRVVDGTTREDRVQIESVLTAIAGEIGDDHPEARIEIDVPPGLTLETDREVCRIVFANLVANGVEHAETDRPTVTVRLTETPAVGAVDGEQTAFAAFEVLDNGPGIPESETAVLDEHAETALEHGSGLGLWVVQSGIAALGGDVSFDGSADGTVVRLRLPGVVGLPADSRPVEAGE